RGMSPVILRGRTTHPRSREHHLFGPDVGLPGQVDIARRGHAAVPVMAALTARTTSTASSFLHISLRDAFWSPLVSTAASTLSVPKPAPGCDSGVFTTMTSQRRASIFS